MSASQRSPLLKLEKLHSIHSFQHHRKFTSRFGMINCLVLRVWSVLCFSSWLPEVTVSCMLPGLSLAVAMTR